uniref:Uncharacterized protein n=1 Tax=Aegilops tauschii subsp. strangulata TaxID=200361 RepID=A0A453DVI4_AEGTS
LRHRRPRRRRPSPLSPYLHTAHEGGRAAPNRSEQQLPDPDREGPQIVTFLRPLNPLCRPTPQLPGRRAGREEPPPRSTRTGRARGSMAKLYMQAVPPLDLNKNTEWFMYLGVWTTHIFILFVSWLLILSIFGCTPSMAWTLVNLGHFAVPASPPPPLSPSLTRPRLLKALIDSV